MKKEILKALVHMRKEIDALEKLVLQELKEDVPAVDPNTAKMREAAAQIIRMFNEICETSYSIKADKNVKPVIARINDGRKPEDFKLVIEDRKSEWARDKKMCNYLRPETVFGPKFEGYLNIAMTKRKRSSVLTGSDEVEQAILRRLLNE